MKKGNVILLCVMLVLLTACLTFSLSMHFAAPHLLDDLPTASKIAAIERRLQKYYIDDYDPVALGDAAAEAMIEATGDRWSFYLPAEKVSVYQDQLDNAYTGIGVTIYEKPTDQGFTVATVQKDGPAEKAGVSVGDVLTQVEGVSALELGFSEMRNRVMGELGSWVNLTFLRNGKEYSVKVQRLRIDTLCVQHTILDSGVGYVRIANFDRNSSSQTIESVEEFKEQNVAAVIFDVRSNPGGLRSELVKLLDYLLPEGVVFQSRDYTGSKETEYSDANFLDMKMVVLVDKHTYSAAEFFAAALQEYGAATVVGEKTSGKGEFQSLLRLPDGSGINLSVGKYFTPSGKSLSDVGLVPDVLIPVPEKGDAKEAYEKQLKKAEEILLPPAAANNGS